MPPDLLSLTFDRQGDKSFPSDGSSDLDATWAALLSAASIQPHETEKIETFMVALRNFAGERSKAFDEAVDLYAAQLLRRVATGRARMDAAYDELERALDRNEAMSRAKAEHKKFCTCAADSGCFALR